MILTNKKQIIKLISDGMEFRQRYYGYGWFWESSDGNTITDKIVSELVKEGHIQEKHIKGINSNKHLVLKKEAK